MDKTKTERNSILEILRLCAALWIMYYHGLSLIARTQAFSNGRIAVDFFFLLSGFFFLASYIKEDDKPLFKGMLYFIWKRFKPLSITFAICMAFSLAYFIQFYEGFIITGIWGYLWYVPHVLVVFAFYFLIKRLIKNEIVFLVIVSIISIVCYSLTLTYIVDYGIIRGLASVGYGILLSKIPKLSFKNSNIVAMVITTTLFVSITLIAIYCPIPKVEDPICLILLFPSIIYFASNINLKNQVINNICSISFGLYAYQAVTRVFEENGLITIGWQMFLIVLALAIIDAVIKILIKNKNHICDSCIYN